MFYNAEEKAGKLETGGTLLKGLQFTSTDLKNLYNIFLTIEPVGTSLKENLASSKTLAARGVTLDELRGMLILYKGHAYSKWCAGSQKDFPEYSSLVPIPWAAAKAAYGTPYSSWKPETFGMGYFISTARNEFIESEEFVDRYVRLEEMLLNDAELMNWARSASITGNRVYAPHNIKDTDNYTDFVEEYNKGFGGPSATRWCRILLLQVWLAGGELRSDKMILCPYDYDRIPEYIPSNKDRKKKAAQVNFNDYMKQELGF